MKKHKFQALMAWNAAQSQVKDLMEALGPREIKTEIKKTLKRMFQKWV